MVRAERDSSASMTADCFVNYEMNFLVENSKDYLFAIENDKDTEMYLLFAENYLLERISLVE